MKILPKYLIINWLDLGSTKESCYLLGIEVAYANASNKSQTFALFHSSPSLKVISVLKNPIAFFIHRIKLVSILDKRRSTLLIFKLFNKFKYMRLFMLTLKA